MIRSGDEDHIITRAVPGTDPLQDFEDDDPSQTIIIDHDTDASSDVDDLSEVSITSAGVVIGKTLPSRKPSPLQEHKIFGCRYLIRRGVHRKMVITTVYLRVRCMSLT